MIYKEGNDFNSKCDLGVLGVQLKKIVQWWKGQDDQTILNKPVGQLNSFGQEDRVKLKLQAAMNGSLHLQPIEGVAATGSV